MSNGFVHSVKVPRLYKTAAQIVRSVRENGESFKSLIYDRKHPNVSAVYALSYNTLQNGVLLDSIIRNTGLLIKEPRLDPWLARILITELIWGKKSLMSDCKPVQTILAHEKDIREAVKNTANHEQSQECAKTVKKPRYIRVNTLLLSVTEAISIFEQEGWVLLSKSTDYSAYLTSLTRLSGSYFIQDFHIPELFAFPPQTTFYNNECYQKGEIILQDKASCLPAFLLNPEPGSVVLDMCAAPGMKTTHLAAIIKNHGTIYATELHARRYQTLCDQLKVTHSTCVKALHKDALTLDEKECSNVEYILVDPTCSGSGMINRPKLGEEDGKCDRRRLQSLQAFQVFLLRHALLNFPSAKRIVYSTCSMYSKENEEVIEEILSDVGDAYRLVPVKKLLQDNWINYSSKNFKCEDNCLYARPQVDCCNGFFVAVFERNFDVPLPEYKRRSNRSLLEPVASNGFHSASHLNADNQNNDATSAIDTSKKRKKRGKRKRKSEAGEELTATEESSNKIDKQDIEEKVVDTPLVPNIEINNTEGENTDSKHKKKKSKKTKALDTNSTEKLEDTAREAENVGDDSPNISDIKIEETEEPPPEKKKKSKKTKAVDINSTEKLEDTARKAENVGDDLLNISDIKIEETEEPLPEKKKKSKKTKAVDINSTEKLEDIARKAENVGGDSPNISDIKIEETEEPLPEKKKKSKKTKAADTNSTEKLGDTAREAENVDDLLNVSDIKIEETEEPLPEKKKKSKKTKAVDINSTEKLEDIARKAENVGGDSPNISDIKIEETEEPLPEKKKKSKKTKAADTNSTEKLGDTAREAENVDDLLNVSDIKIEETEEPLPEKKKKSKKTKAVDINSTEKLEDTARKAKNVGDDSPNTSDIKIEETEEPPPKKKKKSKKTSKE